MNTVKPIDSECVNSASLPAHATRGWTGLNPSNSVPRRKGWLKRVAWMTFCLIVTIGLSPSAMAQDGQLTFAEQELATQLTVGYAVRLIDMNNDDRLDICIVDSKRILWLENPNWNEHVLIETPDRTDNVCFAPYDINGDGRLDFAVGADWTVNTREGGSIHWLAQLDDQSSEWTLMDIGTEPTVHRMQFADLTGDGRDELIVLPLMGRNTSRPDFAETGVRILTYEIPDDPVTGSWEPRVLNDKLHVTHNLWPCDMNDDGRTELLVVSFEGVHLFEMTGSGRWHRTRIGTGNQETSPNRGASEVKLGALADGEKFIATIEPWHGHQVVIYREPEQPQPNVDEWLWERQVIDEELKWGHAVFCVNLDSDPEDEVVIGVRDNRDDDALCGLRLYDLSDDGERWVRTLVDPGGVAIEDLSAGDLNGDGKADIVAVGRRTRNVKIYWNETDD